LLRLLNLGEAGTTKALCSPEKKVPEEKKSNPPLAKKLSWIKKEKFEK